MQINMEMNRTTTMAERKTISIMKACELVGVSRRTIYNWIAGGKVEYVRTAGGSVRIFVDTLWREPARTADLVRKEAS
jgi:excisionase family DNA binding protein